MTVTVNGFVQNSHSNTNSLAAGSITPTAAGDTYAVVVLIGHTADQQFITLADGVSNTYTACGLLAARNNYTLVTALTVGVITAITLGSSTSATITSSNAAGSNPWSTVTKVNVIGVVGMTQINGLDMAVTATGGSSGAWTVTATTPTNTAWGGYSSGGTLSPDSGVLNASYSQLSYTNLVMRLSTGALVSTVTATNGTTAITWTGGIPASATTAISIGDAQCLLFYYAASVSGSAANLTVTQSSSSNINGVWLADISGLSTSPFLAFASNYQNGDENGANAVFTATTTGVSGSNWAIGFAMDGNAATPILTAGTSPIAWTGMTAVWATFLGTAAAVPEYAAVTGNIAATWGTNSSIQFDDFYTGVMVFGIAATIIPPQRPFGPMPKQIYIMP